MTKYLGLSLFTKEGEQLTEIGSKNMSIAIDYHLNGRHNYRINVDEISSFFLHES